MDEDKIILDRKSFEALAVDSRVRILKSLKQRRKTLSELANEQKMSVSGVKEHLETLEKVGLIEKMDDGHKWKYYELTKKGNEIIGPKEIRVWILLMTAVIALLASFTAMFSVPTAQMADVQPITDQPEMLTAASAYDNGSGVALNGEPTERNDSQNNSDKLIGSLQPFSAMRHGMDIPLIVAVISVLAILGCSLILIKNRMKPNISK